MLHTESERFRGYGRFDCFLLQKMTRKICTCFRYASKSLPRHPTCCHGVKTKFKCSTLSMQDIRRFHQNFYATSDKITQDHYILRYVINNVPKRSRPRTQHGSRKTVTVTYYMPRLSQASGRVLVHVCQKAFLDTLGVSKFRVQRLCKEQLRKGTSPKENRGGDRRTKHYTARRQNVRAFIESFQPLESHYCRERSKKQYLPSELSIKSLWRMYNNTTDDCLLRVKYDFFRTIFDNDYNISFRSPATDKCSRCIELEGKMKTENNVNVKQGLRVEYRVHKLRSKAFYEMLKENHDNAITFSFDCQKNMVLPKVPDQSAYYSRQFYVYNFTVCRGSSKTEQTTTNTFIYTWTELDAHKGSNEISSCVYHRLQNTVMDTTITTIRLFADGCGGQNKNSTMIGMVSKWLKSEAPQHIKEVHIIFPVPGHSFLPADRVFGRIEKRVKAKEVIVSPQEYFDIFGEFGTVVRPGNAGFAFYDWKSATTEIVRPTSSWHFKFCNTKRFILNKSKEGKVLIRGEPNYRTDLIESKGICRRGKCFQQINPRIVPLGLDPHTAKANDVNKLLSKHYGPEWKENANLAFYRDVLAGEYTTVHEEDDDEPMVDEDLRV